MLVHWGVDALPSICSFACWQVRFVHSVVHFIALRCITTKIWHKTFQSPVILPIGGKTRRKKKQQRTHAKILKIHPRKISIHWRRNGREAQAPLGTQPEGVSCLSGTCSVSLYSGPLPQVRKQSLTDPQSDTASSTLWCDMKSAAGGENQMLGQLYLWRDGGWGGDTNVYSWA